MDRVLIVGASGRAAAASARRAGFEPFVLDLFADADTERLATVFRLPMTEYPDGFVELAKRVPPMPWMFTGGLENYPDVVAAISEQRELRGIHRNTLRVVRDPFLLHFLLQGSGFESPRLRQGTSRTPSGERWLRKPLRGSAGSGITFARPESEPFDTHFFQEFIEGASFSAIFRSERFIAATDQLVGTPWLHAKPFQYAGSMGPVPSRRLSASAFRSLGVFLANQHIAEGLFGLDIVYDGERCHVVEINPRYTASVEVIELASRFAILTDASFATPLATIGKAIYYAPHRIVFPASGPWDESLAHCTDVWRLHDFADIPHAGDVIEVGHPVCTIFAEGAHETECEEKLKSRANALDRLFDVG